MYSVCGHALLHVVVLSSRTSIDVFEGLYLTFEADQYNDLPKKYVHACARGLFEL